MRSAEFIVRAAVGCAIGEVSMDAECKNWLI